MITHNGWAIAVLIGWGFYLVLRRLIHGEW